MLREVETSWEAQSRHQSNSFNNRLQFLPEHKMHQGFFAQILDRLDTQSINSI